MLCADIACVREAFEQRMTTGESKKSESENRKERKKERKKESSRHAKGKLIKPRNPQEWTHKSLRVFCRLLRVGLGLPSSEQWDDCGADKTMLISKRSPLSPFPHPLLFVASWRRLSSLSLLTVSETRPMPVFLWLWFNRW
jgi:hypothetical protein